MKTEYQKIIEYMMESGRRIEEKSGQIDDIGVKKQYLTEEDIEIERGFTKLIQTFPGDHIVFAEEENDLFSNGDNVWVIDPISSTYSFINGLPHYAIVCSHLHKGEIVFAAVYDPSVNELFTAVKGEGANLNSKRIFVKQIRESVIYNLCEQWFGTPESEEIWKSLFSLNVHRNFQSFAVNYCWVAAGRFTGVVALTKDAFPEYAGKLLIEEAGGIFTNEKGDDSINPNDRIFIGGTQETYSSLRDILKTVL